MDSLKCVDYVDKKRTISAYYHEKLRSGARMGTLWHQQTPSTGRGTNVNAVQWALDNGVTAGTTESTFSPDNTCTRAQIVTFLYRAMV